MADRFTVKFETRRFQRFTRELVKAMPPAIRRKTLRAVALEFLGKVIKRTPVDKGRARSGWTPFLDALGKSAAVGGSDPAAQARGKSEGSYREEASAITIINGVPYIVPLETGHSKQAPAGMMRITMRELASGQALTKELLAEYKRQIIRADLRSRRA